MKQKRNKGFTLAETLSVVAIVLILSAIAFVAVYQYRRSMRQLEYDAVAKEIFIVAQNHLTMADNQGLVGSRTGGTQDTDESGKEIFYFVHPDTSPADETSVLSLMLPFGSIEDTARIGGSYVIRYQKSSARILDVFYSSETDQTGLLGGLGCSFSGLSEDGYKTLKGYAGDEKKADRRDYHGKVIGWYGGGEDLPVAEELKAPAIRIINADKLTVVVTNPNKANPYERLTLYVRGKTSKQSKTFVLSLGGNEQNDCIYSGDTISFDLDDITTSGKHFAEQFDSFYPGEDIEVWAVADSNTAIANIAESAKLTTNSLFAAVDLTSKTADIAYTRHLENLDRSISGFDTFNLAGITSFSARQTADLKWADFKNATESRTILIKNGETGATITAGSFYPVDPAFTLEEYDGQKHSLTGYDINTSGKAGMFAKLSSSQIKDLELIDFNILNGTDSGALIGTATGVTVTNVLARNSRPDDGSRKITASDSAGGLIGSMTNGSVTNSAAALIVSGGTDAGGLIGSMSGGSVEKSYAGGHTDGSGRYSTTAYNVTGATAGGLIGTSSGTITNCYSTCSAKGTTAAGGLIGNSGGTVSSSYATGLVDAPDGSAGALVGTGTAGGTGNKYLWIINQDQTWMIPFIDQYKTDPTGAETGAAGMTGAADVTKSTADYNSFFEGDDPAQPYDAKLLASFEGKYPMLSIKDLVNSVNSVGTDDYVSTHYGDWPMPETLVINN